MQIGLIGGIGPAAQDYYTRQLIGLFREAEAPLEMTTAHADTVTLLSNLGADRRSEQAGIFLKLTEQLADAGAGFVAVTSIAGHFCRSEFAALSPLPIIDMIDAVSAYVAASGYSRLGILGTRTVMESHLYGGIVTASVIAPDDADIDAAHTAYADMAAIGAITARQQEVFDNAAQKLVNVSHVEAIILGGTDLTLAFDAATCPFKLIDCAAIHVTAIASVALGN